MKSLSSINIDVLKYTLLRRKFHQIPEIGYKEFKTKDLILETLKNFENFETSAKLYEVGDTGMYLDIYGKGKKLADYPNEKYLISLRADMDGLPFTEESDVEYKSVHENMIHGCGHDGHITILLATIEYYLSNLEKIPENFGVRFLFQPAEEGLLGAVQMIKGGCLQNVSEIYGLHNLTAFKVGEIGVIPGTIMARVDIFKININGKGGHSSTPHNCCSPINTGAQIITAINQISSQEIDSIHRNAIGIGCFHAGETFNVIPERGVIKGTIRSVDDQTGEKILNRITEVSQAIGIMNRCQVEVLNEMTNYCTINHIGPNELVEKLADKYYIRSSNYLPLMASEDFSFYMREIPGCFFMLGTYDENHKDYPHTPKYDFNDVSIPIGVEMFIRIIEEKASVKLI
jgi:amidohydrolase